LTAPVIVLDSSFLIAFHNTKDVHHGAAQGVMERLMHGEWEHALLLEYVFLEVVTVLRMRLDLATAVNVGDALLRAREIEFVPCSDVFSQAFDSFRTVSPAPLSFTDAAIVAVAKRHSPGFVATFDRDFKKLEGVTVVG
jgi:predicted nucleic acid-binding protein